MAENKTKPTSASVEAFITRIENPVRQADTRTALELYKEITGFPPVMWGPSIIGFGSRQYFYKSGRKGEMPLACFAPRKANMTFYVSHKFNGAQELYAQLGKHKKSVACLYITKLCDVDLDILKEIVRRGIAQIP